MVNVAKEIEKRGLRSRLILQVHDELIVDAAADEVDSVKAVSYTHLDVYKRQLQGLPDRSGKTRETSPQRQL